MKSFGLLVAFSLLAISEALVPATIELTPQGIKAIIPGGFNEEPCTSNAYSGCKREAIEMLPMRDAYGRWPASGQIDIVESRGNENYHDMQKHSKGVDTVSSSLHFGPNDQHDRSDKAHAEDILSAGTFADSFHKFGVEWDENKISCTVDGKTILSITPPPGGFWELGEFNISAVGLANPWHESYGVTIMTPFDQQFYLVLDVAVGGTFFPDNWYNLPYPKPWRNDTEFVVRDFWQARHLWYPTWHTNDNNGESAALQINNIKV